VLQNLQAIPQLENGRATMTPVSELPPDPDEDALPPNLALALDVHGDDTLMLSATDPDTGEVFSAPLDRADVAAAFADRRRYVEDDDSA
jgi:hypothetical protein